MAEFDPGRGSGNDVPPLPEAAWAHWYAEAFTYEGPAVEFTAEVEVAMPGVMDLVQQKLADALESQAEAQGLTPLYATVVQTQPYSRVFHGIFFPTITPAKYELTVRAIKPAESATDTGVSGPELIPVFMLALKVTLAIVIAIAVVMTAKTLVDVFHGRPRPLFDQAGRPLIDPATGQVLYSDEGQGLFPSAFGNVGGTAVSVAVALLAVLVGLAIWNKSKTGESRGSHRVVGG